jgi:hypothetical protein
VSPEQQKLRAIRAWANPRKRVAVELRERATGAASPEAAELKTWAERLRALAQSECKRAAEASGLANPGTNDKLALCRQGPQRRCSPVR